MPDSGDVKQSPACFACAWGLRCGPIEPVQKDMQKKKNRKTCEPGWDTCYKARLCSPATVVTWRGCCALVMEGVTETLGKTHETNAQINLFPCSLPERLHIARGVCTKNGETVV